MANREELLSEAKRRNLDVSSYDKNHLMAEAKRRGLNIPNQQMGVEDAENSEQILDILGIDRNKAPKNSLEQIKNMYGGFDVAATKGGLGISQLLAQMLSNKEGDFGHRWQDTIEKMRLANEEKAEGLAGSNDADLGAMFANAVKSGPALIAGGAVGKGLGTLGLGSASSPLLQWGGNALKNILSAGVFGGVNEGMNVFPQGEERLPHMQEGAINAAKYAALFEALGLGVKAIKGEYKLPTFMSQNKVGAEIGGDAKALSAELGDVYDKVRTTSNQKGIKANTKQTVIEPVEAGLLDARGKPITREVSKAPSMKALTEELPGAPKDIVRNVHSALESGDIGDLIDAEKMLGKTKNKMWLNDKRGMQVLDQDAYDAMTHMEGKINNHISEALNKHEPTLADELFAARNKYHKELGPYLDVPAIREYMHGNLKEKDLVRLLQSNTKSGTQFRAKLADKYKAVGQNKFKNDLGKMGLKATRIGEILLLIGGG